MGFMGLIGFIIEILKGGYLPFERNHKPYQPHKPNKPY